MEKQDQAKAGRLIDELEATGDYRVLHRLKEGPRQYNSPGEGEETKLAIMLDLETTGLDPSQHEIIEIGMVPFQYSAKDGRIFDVGEAFDELEEPTEGITDEITRITGITMDMVKGKKIDAEKVEELA